MPKKVIDIFPPRKPVSLGMEESPSPIIPDQQELPQKVPVATKPKITFIERPNVEKKSGQSNKSPLTGILIKVTVGVFVVVAAMMITNWKFARAVVTIWPETTNFSEQTRVVVDTSAKTVDFDKKIIPGITVSVEKTIKNENPVTGKKSVQAKAHGTVKIFNDYTAPQRLVKGTRLQAPLEKFQPALAKDEVPWFRTDADIVIDPKSSATVNVTADAAGEKYNIAPSIFSVPGLVGTAQYTFIYAQSFEKFQGGSMGNALLATQDDLDNAKTSISGTAKDAIEKELASAVPEGSVLIKETAKYSFEDPVISAASGAQVDKVEGQVKAKATAIAYKKDDLDNLGKKFILNDISENNAPYEESMEIRSSYAGSDQGTGRPSLTLAANVLIYQRINESDLKKGLLEKSKKEATVFLNNMPCLNNPTCLKEVKIFIAPPWQPSIPRELDRVEIKTIIE